MRDWERWVVRMCRENKRLCIVCGCFISTVRWKIHPFFLFSPSGSTAKAFCRLSLWSFKEKSINHFYNTAYFFIGSVIVCGCFISKARWKIRSFYPIFPLAESGAKVFCWLFLWNFKEKGTKHFLGHSLFIKAVPQQIDILEQMNFKNVQI